MHGQQRPDRRGLSLLEQFFYACGVKIEGNRVNIGQQWRGSRPQNGADGSEEAERSGDDCAIWTDIGCGQSQPKSVCSRSAANGFGHAQVLGSSAFEAGNGLAENELP